MAVTEALACAVDDAVGRLVRRRAAPAPGPARLMRVVGGRGHGDFVTVVRAAGADAEDLGRELRAAVPDLLDAAEAHGAHLALTLTDRALAAVPGDVLAGAVDDSGAGSTLPPPQAGTDVERWAAAASLPAGSALPALAALDDSSALYLVRRAHAHACTLLRHAAALDVGPASDPEHGAPADPEERRLLCVLAGHPAALGWRRPTDWLEDLAVALFALAERRAVLPAGDEPTGPEHRRRLLLVDAARAALADGLARIGVTAPSRC